MIEDHAADAELIRAYLKRAAGYLPGELEHVGTLEEALGALAERPYDLVLLDLMLPGYRELRSLTALGDWTSTLPVVILTCAEDADLEIRSLQCGAEDFLRKGELTPSSLYKAVRHAIERHRARREERVRQQQREQQMSSLESFLERSHLPVSSRVLGVEPIKTSHPAFFAQAVKEFTHWVDQAVEKRVFGESFGNNSALQRIATQLCTLGAGPRDAIDLFSTAVRRQEREDSKLRRLQFFVEEAKILLLEMMGHMVSGYRARSWIRERQQAGGIEKERSSSQGVSE